MNREQAIVYLRFSGFSDEQIKAIEDAFTCKDCVSALNRVMEYTYGMLTAEKAGLQHLIKSMLDDMPPVKPQEPKTRWIPIKTRPLTNKEKEEYADLGYSEDSIDSMYDCPLPDDGEEVLITTRYDEVITDTFYRDYGCYFETYCDKDDVKAWMPKPEPYKAEGSEKE